MMSNESGAPRKDSMEAMIVRSHRLDDQIQVLRQRILEQQSTSSSQDALLELTETLSVAWEELQVAGEQVRQQNEQLIVAEEEVRQQNDELLAMRLELETERERYRNLFSFAPDGYIITDTNGTILEANTAISTLLRVKSRFLIGKPLCTFVPLADRAEFRSQMEYAAETGGHAFELVLTRRNAASLPVAFTMARVPEAPTLTISRKVKATDFTLLWLVRDITVWRQTQQELLNARSELERRVEERTAQLTQANTALHQLHQRLAVLVDGARDYAMFMQEPNGTILSWNEGARRIFGHEPDDIVGQHVRILFTPEDRSHGAPEKEMHTAATEGRAEDKRWHLRRDGSRFFANGVLTSLRDDAGDLIGYAKVARDATAQKQAEDDLHRVHKELEKRVIERTAALQDEVLQRQHIEIARQKLLRQLMTAQEDERRRLSRELHDQLGQHLSALSLGLRALQDQQEALPHGERRASAEQVEELRHRTEGIMQRVHRLAWELRPAVLDDWGLHTAIELYTAQWARHCGVEVDFHSIGFMESGMEQRIDPEAESTLYRVMQEALTNVERHADASRVSLLLEKRGDMVQLIIEDNGKGFDAEAMEKLPAHQRRLGLLGMHERIALVNGTLTIESLPNFGTTVFARIPLRQNGEEARHEEAADSLS